MRAAVSSHIFTDHIALENKKLRVVRSVRAFNATAPCVPETKGVDDSRGVEAHIFRATRSVAAADGLFRR